MSDAEITNQSIQVLRGSLSGGTKAEAFLKSWGQPTSATGGIQNYSLDAPAKILFPVLTPLRNSIPRLSADGGIQANWRAITGVNTAGIDAGLSDGNRGGVISETTVNYFAAYVQIGLDNFVTWAAQLAAEGFMDLVSQAQTNLLWATMLAEEALDLGGCGTAGLGRGNRPVLADIGTGGALAANTTFSVIVAPLTLAGYRAATIANGVRGVVTRSNADGSSDSYGGGTGQPSQNQTVTTANDGNATHAIGASTAPVAGAVGYAWFWGPAGAEILGAITAINSVVIMAAAAGTQTAASLGASDNSQNALVYDGLLTQVAKTGSGGYFYAMPTGTAGAGTPLTADGSGGVVEIDAALQSFWDNYRLSPDNIWVSSQEQRNITRKVLSGSTNAAQRFVINTEQGNVTGGDLVTSYLNKFSMAGARSIPIKLHPNLPPGTMLFTTTALPYPMSNVPNVLVKRLRQDYHAVLWAPKSRKYEYGVYFDGVLQNYFPPAFGVITNIANG